MARQLTAAAQVAKEIRQKLKAAGIKATVRKSGTSSVRIYLTNENPRTVSMVKSAVDCYQYYGFDGMTDCGYFRNENFDGPQCQFVFVENEYTDDIYQDFYSMLRATHSWFSDLSESYSEAMSKQLPSLESVSMYIWRELNDMQDEDTKKFWRSRKPVKKLGAK